LVILLDCIGFKIINIRAADIIEVKLLGDQREIERAEILKGKDQRAAAKDITLW
jgi:hypothetical protein